MKGNIWGRDKMRVYRTYEEYEADEFARLAAGTSKAIVRLENNQYIQILPKVS